MSGDKFSVAQYQKRGRYGFIILDAAGNHAQVNEKGTRMYLTRANAETALTKLRGAQS